MIIDPCIAVLRSPAPLDFYERVVARIARRTEQPKGLVMQLAGSFQNELRLLTVYRDSVSMFEGFANFVAPEASDEMRESGEAYDISRDEFELEALEISPSVPQAPVTTRSPGSIVAVSNELVEGYTVEEYRKFTSASGWFEDDAAGRLGHVAYSSAGRLYSMDIWESREQADAWFRDHGRARIDEHFSRERDEKVFEASWWEVHNFAVPIPADDPLRHYTRQTSGPADSSQSES